MKFCSVDGCENKHEAKGYCKKHYRTFKKYGDPLVKPERKPYPKRKSKTPYEDNHKTIEGIEYKLCSDCKEWHPMNGDWFYKNKTSPDGFNPYCKEATKKRSWAWQKDNWDKMLIHFKKENAKQEKKQRHRELYWERKEKGYYQDYYDKNKEKFKGYNANRRNKNHDISNKEWEACKEYFNHSCAYCEFPLELHKEIHNQDLHREHVDPNGKNDLSNCIPSCVTCNVRKKVKSLSEWYNRENENFSTNRLSRIFYWLETDYIDFKE